MREYFFNNDYVTIETKEDFESIIEDLEFQIGCPELSAVNDTMAKLKIKAISWACSHEYREFCLYAFEIKPNIVEYYLDDGDELILIARDS